MYKPWGRKASLEDRNSTGSKVSSVQEATAGDREAFQSASGTTGSATQTHRKTHKIHKRIQLSVFRWGSMLALQHSQDISSFFCGESEKCLRTPFITQQHQIYTAQANMVIIRSGSSRLCERRSSSSAGYSASTARCPPEHTTQALSLHTDPTAHLCSLWLRGLTTHCPSKLRQEGLASYSGEQSK